MAIQAQFYLSDDVSQICNNGYGAGGFVESCFNSQQKHHHHHHHHQQLEQRLQQFYNESQRPINPNPLVYNPKHNNNHHPTSNSSPSLAFQYEMQREQMDQYLRLQNEKLRLVLQEQGKQQVAVLLRKLESRSLSMLREKDEEIAQASKKRVELEDYLRRLEAENQAWQRIAQENEAMALSLGKTLEEMRERGSFCFNNNGNGMLANDAESCCEGTGENGAGEFERITREMMVCKSCHSRTSCFLFLPCRHLSSCKVCDAFLEACPVCGTQKKGSIETLIF